MDWAIAIQRWLYGGMSEGMRSTADLSGLPALMGAAFLFGMVHALMPGHGKSVLVSYHLGRSGRLIEGVMTGTLLALTHVGMAVVLVMAGVAVISRSLAAGGRAPVFEAASAALITVIGLFMVGKAIWLSAHTHERDGKKLAVVTGLIPCPLTTFILTYAIANHQLAVGFAAVTAMFGGVVVTLVSFAVAAVAARDKLIVALRGTELLRERIGYWMELGAAIAVFLLGFAMLWDRFGRL